MNMEKFRNLKTNLNPKKRSETQTQQPKRRITSKNLKKKKKERERQQNYMNYKPKIFRKENEKKKEKKRGMKHLRATTSSNLEVERF